MTSNRLVAIGLLLLNACGDDTNTNANAGGPRVAQQRCEAPVSPTCQDQQLLELFYETPASGQIENTSTSEGFISDVDATAGGFGGSLGFVYAKFTDSGLQRVDITDEESLDNMEWQIAFRRYVIRLNSGVSGPSCVKGSRIPGNPSFSEVDSLGDLNTHEEQYYGPNCDLIPDGSGLPSAPATVLSSFWSYGGCVAMSGYVYGVQLDNGRDVKLEVTQYYKQGQQTCNASGTPGTSSGNLQVHWSFL